jgi:hypothetical protein
MAGFGPILERFAGQRRQGSGQAQDAGWVKQTRVCSDRGEAVFGLDVGTSLSQALAFMVFMRAPRGDQLRIYRRLGGQVVQERDVTRSRSVTVDSGKRAPFARHEESVATLIHGTLSVPPPIHPAPPPPRAAPTDNLN